MNSREKILSRLKAINRSVTQRDHTVPGHRSQDIVEQFSTTLVMIGGSVVEVKNITELNEKVKLQFPTAKMMVSGIKEVSSTCSAFQENPHDYKDVDVAILEGEFGVAENGAVWITDRTMIDRALPFICQHLVLVIKKEKIVPTLHEAYELIETQAYHFGTFIAGPSKTADIEQSLVLGAHGPKSLTVCLV